MSEDDRVKVYAPIKREDWLNRKWRPAMAVTYMAICIFDFILGPLVNYWFFRDTGAVFSSWKPLTMTDGGFFHMAMGAIIGITAWQRGKEKTTRFESGNFYDDEVGSTYQPRPGRRPPPTEQPEL